MQGTKTAATIYVAPRFLTFLMMCAVFGIPFYLQSPSNGGISPCWSVRLICSNFSSPFGRFNRSSNGLPRRPVSSWHKRGYVCIYLPRKDLTIFMDIEKNPGPLLITNHNQLLHLNASTAVHRPSQSLLVFSSTSILALFIHLYVILTPGAICSIFVSEGLI